MDWFDKWLDWHDAHPGFMKTVVVMLTIVTLLEIWSVARG